MVVDGRVVRRVDPSLRKRNYSKGTPFERAMRRVLVDESTGCWEWQGSKVPAGYGHLNVGGGRFRHAHIVTYEELVGVVPDGLELDHLCRNRSCVNPEHLEAVTHHENVLRGASALHHRTGRCGRGHDLSEHGYQRKDGRLNCRECRREKRAAEEWK